MNLFYINEHITCAHYANNTICGFKLKSLIKGTPIKEEHLRSNIIVFVLMGSIEISCCEFTNKLSKKGQMLFLPQASAVTGLILEEAELIIFAFNSSDISLCEKFKLNSLSYICKNLNSKEFTLEMRSPLPAFLNLLKSYLLAGVDCAHLHEIKQKELFIILRTAYSKEEIAGFFFPIIGKDIDFKSIVLQNYRMGYNLSEFAAAMAMSPTSLQKKIKEEFGTTFHQWMLKQKAKEIKHKLTLPSTSLADIVADFDFSSPSHLTKFCKMQFGCTPIELIKKLRP